MDPLVVDELSKRYGRMTAVDGLSFAVPAGSVCGFLGPNGAGKTTTLRILLGLARASGGRAQTRGRVSGVLDRDGFHPGRTAFDELALAARRAGRGDPGEALERAGLGHIAGRRIGACSFGMRRRLAVAAALLAEPDVLLLDEPATGLDPHALRDLRTRLRELASGGGTVLLSSHVLEEVAATCDRVVVVDRGRAVAAGPLDELLAQRIRLRSPGRGAAADRAPAARPGRDGRRPREGDRRRRGPRRGRPRRPRQRRDPARDEHAGRARGALRRPHRGVVTTEFRALRTVAGYRRALALAIATAAFLVISFLGVRDLDQTTAADAASALSVGAVSGFVAVVYSAATAGGEIARGGLALALLADPDRGRALRNRLAAHALAGAAIGLTGAAAAAVLAFVLLAAGGAPLPGAGELAARGAGTIVYGALAGAAGAALGLALRSPAAAVITILVVLLALDPLFAGLSTEVARWGPGGAAGSLTGSGADDLPPPWAGGLALLAYAAALSAVAAALTARRDVP